MLGQYDPPRQHAAIDLMAAQSPNCPMLRVAPTAAFVLDELVIPDQRRFTTDGSFSIGVPDSDEDGTR